MNTDETQTESEQHKTANGERTGSRTEPRSWSCFRLDGDRPERLGSATANGVELSSWPIEHLSADTIRARWGTGTFRVQYLDGRGQPCGRKLLKLTERTLPKKRKEKRRSRRPSDARAVSSVDSVQAVVALMGVAQSQASMLVDQVRTDAQRTVEREREFIALTMKQHETVLAELARERTERRSDPTEVLTALREISAKLDVPEEGDDPLSDDVEEEPEPLWRVLMKELAPHCAPGLNALLAAAAPGVGKLIEGLSKAGTPPSPIGSQPAAPPTTVPTNEPAPTMLPRGARRPRLDQR